MAGIAFELRKLTRDDTLAGTGRAYLYAGFISSGPWILSILTMVLLSRLLGGALPDRAELDFFSASVTHVYAFSLILVGPFQLVLTRYAADKFASRERRAVFPSYLSALLVVSLVAAVVAAVFFFGFVSGPWFHRAASVALMVYVCGIFVTANYLTALRRHRSAVFGFVGGYVASLLAAWLGAVWAGGVGAMTGFAAGHAALLLLLARSLHAEFGSDPAPRADVWKWFRRFPGLALVGFCYNAGIWADKLMFWWFSDQREGINGLWVTPEYDVAICLSLLSIVPGMAVFFLRLETSFAEKYEAFFQAIDGRLPLRAIRDARAGMVDALRRGLGQLLKVQGVVTALLLVFAKPLGTLLAIGSVKVGIFQVTLFGTFMLIGFLSLLTILFYLDDRRGALVCAAAFALANTLLSIPTLLANEAWYGYGFVIAAALALCLAAHRVNHRLAQLESHIFRGQ